MKAHLNHLYVTVGDLPSARAFWSELIGLEVLVEDDEYLRVGGHGGFSMGIERAGEGDAPEVEVVVRVPDVDAAYERLQAAGSTAAGRPRRCRGAPATSGCAMPTVT